MLNVLSRMVFSMWLLFNFHEIYAITLEDRQLTLPDYIYMGPNDSPELDLDRDSLKDDDENRLADAWRPLFIFDEKENAREAFEPLVLFQAKPIGNRSWPRRIRINWGFIWRNDGGFIADNACKTFKRNDHPGDTQGGTYELASEDGLTWTLDKINLWDGYGTFDGSDPNIEWTGLRGTYWNQLPNKPSPIIHASVGKHHQYLTHNQCERRHPVFWCDEDCGGGADVIANLSAFGGNFNNVGEYLYHDNPFINNLQAYYNGEYVWWAAFTCGGKPTFTGGTGKCSKEVKAVIGLFDTSPLPEEYRYSPENFKPQNAVTERYKCGAGFSTYSVRAEGSNGWPIQGIRCVMLSDYEVINDNISGVKWYGEGDWGNWKYRHIGQTYKATSDPTGKKSYTLGLAADIFGNGENAAGSTHNVVLHPISNSKNIRVTGDWNELWTLESDGAAAYKSTLGTVTKCGENLDALEVNRKASLTKGKGIRCLLRIDSYIKFPSVWYGEGNWGTQKYKHLGYTINPTNQKSTISATSSDICNESNFVCGKTDNGGLTFNTNIGCFEKLQYQISGNWLDEIWTSLKGSYNCPK